MSRIPPDGVTSVDSWTLPSLGTGRQHPTQPNKQHAPVYVDSEEEVKDEAD